MKKEWAPWDPKVKAHPQRGLTLLLSNLLEARSLHSSKEIKMWRGNPKCKLSSKTINKSWKERRHYKTSQLLMLPTVTWLSNHSKKILSHNRIRQLIMNSIWMISNTSHKSKLMRRIQPIPPIIQHHIVLPTKIILAALLLPIQSTRQALLPKALQDSRARCKIYENSFWSSLRSLSATGLYFRPKRKNLRTIGLVRPLRSWRNEEK